MPEQPVIAAWAPNLRDVGGLATSDGRSTRYGVLYRSPHLAPSPEEEASIHALAIRSVIDLRSARERDSAPNRFFSAAAVDLVEYDITADFRADDDPLAFLRNDPGEAGAVALMISTYRQLTAAAATAVRGAADLLVREATPLLVHCTAGKDRTGFVCAMLLIAVGVPHDVVIEDYLESSRRIHAAIRDATRTILAQSQIDLTDEALAALNAVRADYLHEALAVIARDYGSHSAYLDALGIDRARLRQVLLS